MEKNINQDIKKNFSFDDYLQQKKIEKELRKKSKLYAIIINGTDYAIVQIPKLQQFFTYKNRSYNVKTDDVFILRIQGLFSKKNYFLYSLNNPDPLKFDTKNFKPSILSSDEYNIIINNEVLRQANSMTRGNFDFEMKHVFIGLGVIAIVVYFIFGGV